MELNAEQKEALALMLSGKNVFLRGDAGTGKTEVINAFIETDPEGIVRLAPTGLAARNLKSGWMTIHRFLKMLERNQQVSPERTRSYLEGVSHLIIEEISMVRSDLLAQLDRVLQFCLKRKAPFGGIPIVVVGDFYQLPPVVKTQKEYEFLIKNLYGIFAFDAPVWSKADFLNVELKTSHPQTDGEFLRLLRSVRLGTEDLDTLLPWLNSRVKKLFPHPEARHLCCYRSRAEYINQCFMERVLSPEHFFTGKCDGNYPEEDWPVPISLRVKMGMFVLLTANEAHGDYVNGDLGIVIAWEPDYICVNLLRGPCVMVARNTWLNYEYSIGITPSGDPRLNTRIIGSFTQFPILPAYAMTIHKAQGQTLDHVHLDLPPRPCFASGQLYTALSRVRKLEDLSLSRPIRRSDINVSEHVRCFYERI